MTKIITHAQLIKANKKAKKAKGNHIDPEWLSGLNPNLRFPILELSLMERQWCRCIVTVGPCKDDLHQLCLDMPWSDFEKLQDVRAARTEVPS